MSWSISLNPVKKEEAELAIDSIEFPDYSEPPARDQIITARHVVKELLRSIPGPYVVINMTGHANGVGWQDKKGYSADFISITVSQQVPNER